MVESVDVSVVELKTNLLEGSYEEVVREEVAPKVQEAVQDIRCVWGTIFLIHQVL